MQIIPLQDTASQTLNVNLASQACTIAVYCKDAYGTFLDLSVNGSPIVTGVICQNMNRIVRDSYLGFVGDLGFMDTQGSDDPVSPGLGGRFVLCYLTVTDLATIAA